MRTNEMKIIAALTGVKGWDLRVIEAVTAIPTKTLTATLQRLKRAGKVTCVNRMWRLVEKPEPDMARLRRKILAEKEPGQVAFEAFYSARGQLVSWKDENAYDRGCWAVSERTVLKAHGVTK